MQHITEQIKEWLHDSTLLPLVPEGFASCALIDDYEKVCRLNQEIRAYPRGWMEGDWRPRNFVSVNLLGLGEDG